MEEITIKQKQNKKQVSSLKRINCSDQKCDLDSWLQSNNLDVQQSFHLLQVLWSYGNKVIV